jgi:hypothetical protein
MHAIRGAKNSASSPIWIHRRCCHDKGRGMGNAEVHLTDKPEMRMNSPRFPADADQRMQIPPPDVDPDPSVPDDDPVPPDGAPHPIGDPPNQRPPERLGPGLVAGGQCVGLGVRVRRGRFPRGVRAFQRPIAHFSEAVRIDRVGPGALTRWIVIDRDLDAMSVANVSLGRHDVIPR